MSNCDFNTDLVCVHCGYQARKPNTIRQCGVNPNPSIIEKVSRYATALAKWIAAGRPTRTQEQIDAILAERCEPCVHFQGGTCDKCGCRINRNPEAWRNKLAMATESCPLDPPKWTAEA
jgi:hypothetical protein